LFVPISACLHIIAALNVDDISAKYLLFLVRCRTKSLLNYVVPTFFGQITVAPIGFSSSEAQMTTRVTAARSHAALLKTFFFHQYIDSLIKGSLYIVVLPHGLPVICFLMHCVSVASIMHT
jgi:hypothetical protein